MELIKIEGNKKVCVYNDTQTMIIEVLSSKHGDIMIYRPPTIEELNEKKRIQND